MCTSVLEKEWRKSTKEETTTQNVLCKYSRVKGKGDKKKNIISYTFFLGLQLFSIGYEMGSNIFIKHSEAVTFKSNSMQGNNFPL